jgi:hypothetical protein
MTTLADSSLLQSLKEDDPSLSLEELLAPALHPTSWDSSFVLRALSFLAECTASPSFVQREFPEEFVKYSFSVLVLPPFEEMVEMARVLDYLGFPVSALHPLIREVTDCVEFSSSDLREFPLFSLKAIDSSYQEFLPFLASNGCLSLVQRVYPGEVKKTHICTSAACYGHLDVLKWMRAQNPPCPWNEWVCCYTAQNGHLDVLKWMRAQEPPCPWNEWACAYAARNGHLDVLKWMRAQNPPCPWNTWTCAYAAESDGHLDVLKWLRSQDPPCPWDEWAFAYAARDGQLDILKWLRAQDPPCPWNEWACACAAENGHLDVLQWLRAQDPPCPWIERVCGYAAQNGHLAVLKWLRSQDPPCPWNEWACPLAAGNGHLDVLKWLRSQDPPCPWNKEECIRMTEKSDVLAWIEEQP